MNVTCIYIKTDASMDAVAAMLEERSGIRLTRSSDSVGPFYEGTTEDRDFGFILAFNEVDWDTSRSEFPLELEVDGYSSDARIAIARGIYDTLVDSGEVSVALWDERDGMLDRFDPNSSAAE